VTAPGSPVDGLAGVVAGEDYGRSLRALRDWLAGQLDGCDSKRDAAALSARLLDTLERIEAIPNKAEVSAADEIAKRRASRRAGPDRPARAKRPG
jgi:hypothetical protein